MRRGYVVVTFKATPENVEKATKLVDESGADRFAEILGIEPDHLQSIDVMEANVVNLSDLLQAMEQHHHEVRLAGTTKSINGKPVEES